MTIVITVQRALKAFPRRADLNRNHRHGDGCGLGRTPFHQVISAAQLIALRRGAGKIRHIGTTLRWAQDRVKNGIINIKKVGTEENPADSLTKQLSRKP